MLSLARSFSFNLYNHAVNLFHLAKVEQRLVSASIGSINELTTLKVLAVAFLRLHSFSSVGNSGKGESKEHSDQQDDG